MMISGTLVQIEGWRGQVPVVSGFLGDLSDKKDLKRRGRRELRAESAEKPYAETLLKMGLKPENPETVRL